MTGLCLRVCVCVCVGGAGGGKMLIVAWLRFGMNG